MTRRVRVRAAAAAALSVIAVVPGALPPARGLEVTPPARIRWLALGDSYSSGLGAGAVSETPSAWGTDCGRATGRPTAGGAKEGSAYPVVASGLLAARGRPVDLSFVACSGSITDGWAHQVAEAYRATGADIPLPPQETSAPTRSSPAVAAIRARAAAGDQWDVVTVSVGGNNIGLEPFVAGCADLTSSGDPASWSSDGWGGCDVGIDAAREQIGLLTGKAPASPGRALVQGQVPLWSDHPEVGDVEPYLEAVARLVRPGGRIFVLGYPRAFADPDRTAVAKGWQGGRGVLTRIGLCEGLAPGDVKLVRNVIDAVNDGISTAVSRADRRWSAAGVRLEYVDVAGTYESAAQSHCLCAADSWVHGFGFQTAAIHPTQAGHDAVGRVVAERVAAAMAVTPPR